ncbi:MAG: sigma-70 family RNA polymerase sigma factor [Acidobacteriota bacterium]|nr:sigma-70 family RNA polymerase sigma factor [Acidobacteriota bacterium]
MISDPTCELLRRCGYERLWHRSAQKPRSPQQSCAWGELVRVFDPLVRGWIRSALLVERGRIPGRGEVEELTQDLYCRLLADEGRRLREFRGVYAGQAHAYLRTTCRRLVLDHLRRRSALKRRGGAHGERRVRLSTPLSEVALDSTEDPEARLLARERLTQLARCCRRLTTHVLRPRRNRAILRLALLEGCSSQEIARRLGESLSPSAVDTVISRLRRKLGRRGFRLAGRGPA